MASAATHDVNNKKQRETKEQLTITENKGNQRETTENNENLRETKKQLKTVQTWMCDLVSNKEDCEESTMQQIFGDTFVDFHHRQIHMSDLIIRVQRSETLVLQV